MLGSSLCDYSKAFTLGKGTITFTNTVVAAVAPTNSNKKVIFKNCALFITCISRISNAQVNDA